MNMPRGKEHNDLMKSPSVKDAELQPETWQFIKELSAYVQRNSYLLGMIKLKAVINPNHSAFNCQKRN